MSKNCFDCEKLQRQLIARDTQLAEIDRVQASDKTHAVQVVAIAMIRGASKATEVFSRLGCFRSQKTLERWMKPARQFLDALRNDPDISSTQKCVVTPQICVDSNAQICGSDTHNCVSSTSPRRAHFESPSGIDSYLYASNTRAFRNSIIEGLGDRTEHFVNSLAELLASDDAVESERRELAHATVQILVAGYGPIQTRQGLTDLGIKALGGERISDPIAAANSFVRHARTPDTRRAGQTLAPRLPENDGKVVQFPNAQQSTGDEKHHHRPSPPRTVHYLTTSDGGVFDGWLDALEGAGQLDLANKAKECGQVTVRGSKFPKGGDLSGLVEIGGEPVGSNILQASTARHNGKGEA